MPIPTLPTLPPASELVARVPDPVRRVVGAVGSLRPPVPSRVADRLDWPVRRRPAIAFFGYSLSGYDGETTNQEDIFEVSPLTGRVRRITDDRGDPVFKSDRDPAWSGGRGTLAIHAASDSDPVSRLYVISRLTGAVVHDLVAGHTPVWLDPKTLLFLDSAGVPGSEDVYSVDVPSRIVQRISDVGAGVEINGIAWHPTAGLAVAMSDSAADTHTICVASAAAVGVARAPGGSPLPRAAFTPVTAAGLRASSPDWSPTADRIALATWAPGQPSRVGVLHVATGVLDPVPGPADPELGDFGPVFAPDGGTLAFLRGYEDEWSEIWLGTLGRGTRRLRRLTDDSRRRFKGSLDW